MGVEVRGQIESNTNWIGTQACHEHQSGARDVGAGFTVSDSHQTFSDPLSRGPDTQVSLQAFGGLTDGLDGVPFFKRGNRDAGAAALDHLCQTYCVIHDGLRPVFEFSVSIIRRESVRTRRDLMENHRPEKRGE